jgi:hypothetical protein
MRVPRTPFDQNFLGLAGPTATGRHSDLDVAVRECGIDGYIQDERKLITMSTTTPTTDTTHDVTRAQLQNALHALRHALRATTPRR